MEGDGEEREGGEVRLKGGAVSIVGVKGGVKIDTRLL